MHNHKTGDRGKAAHNLEPVQPAAEGNGHADASANGTAPDPFDPAAHRLSPTDVAGLGVRKVLTVVPVRKPAKEWWVRVHPGDDYALETAVIDLKEEQEVYLVAPELRDELVMEATFVPKAFFTAINKQGVLFLWPVGLPGPDGRINSWHKSALEAIKLARKKWVRVVANPAGGGYDLGETSVEFPDPVWPEMPFRDILRIAFRDYYVADRNHPVLRRLRGEV
jgi:hypothetical protein